MDCSTLCKEGLRAWRRPPGSTTSRRVVRLLAAQDDDAARHVVHLGLQQRNHVDGVGGRPGGGEASWPWLRES